MSASDIQSGKAFVRIGAKYDQLMTGLKEASQQVKRFAGDVKGMGNLGGSLAALGPVANQVGGAFGGMAGSLTGLLSMNPATWAMAAAGGIYALCDTILEADKANRKAMESSERLAMLYGNMVGPDGVMASGLEQTLDVRVRTMVDTEGPKAAKEKIEAELATLKRDLIGLERDAEAFGYDPAQIEAMKQGQLDLNTAGNVFKQGARDWMSKMPHLPQGFMNSDKDFIGDHTGRQSELEAAAKKITVLRSAIEELQATEKKSVADTWKERKKLAEEVAGALEKANVAADKAVADRERTQTDKMASKDIENNPGEALKKWLDAEKAALNEEADARQKLNALTMEATSLEAKKSELTSAEGGRLKTIKTEMEQIAKAREKATADAAQAVRLGEQAAQAAKREAEALKKAADESAKIKADATLKVLDRIGEIDRSGMAEPERRRLELGMKHADEMASAVDANVDSGHVEQLRMAQAKEMAALEKKLGDETAANKKKNADQVFAHQMALLPREQQERIRMQKEFEEEVKAASERGASEAEINELKRWQAARMQHAEADRDIMGRPGLSSLGGFASAAAGRNAVQGAVSRDKDKSEELLKVNTDMRDSLDTLNERMSRMKIFN